MRTYGIECLYMAQSVDWLSAGLRLQLVVHRKWSSDCQTGALDPKATLPFRNAGHAHTIPNTFAPSSVRWMVA